MTRLRLDDLGSIPGTRRNFSLCHRIQTALESSQHLIKWVPGPLTGSGVWRWPLTSISCVEDKNVCSCTSTLPYVFMAWSLIKHCDHFAWMRFEVLTAVKMPMLVVYVETKCGVVGRCQGFGGTYCLHHQCVQLRRSTHTTLRLPVFNNYYTVPKL
jgi:hypothetical protein